MFSLPHIFLFGCCRNALYTEILWFACRYDFSPAHCFCVLSVWKAARKSRPSSLTVLEFAWMSPQTPLTARSVGWLSASSLCMFACQSAFAFFHISTCPFTFLSSRVCLPTGWIFSATHRAQPLRKTNTSLSLPSSPLFSKCPQESPSTKQIMSGCTANSRFFLLSILASLWSHCVASKNPP